MAGSVNKVILIGNLGKDPEVKSFQNGGRLCNFSIATSESWKDRATGEKKERTEWHNITVQNDGLVGVCERYLRKGSKVYVEGQLRTRKWQDQNGNDRYTTEVVIGFGGVMTMLSSPGERQGGGQQQRGGGGSGGGDEWGRSEWGTGGGGVDATGRSTGGDFRDDLDDDIPF